MTYQIIGWYGVVAILLAYVLVTTKTLNVTDILYVFLNGSGALALIIQSYAIRNWQLVTLNCVWLLVALYVVVEMIRV